MRNVRVLDRPEDFERLGVNPDAVEPWEDGRRAKAGRGKNEVWYFDAIFDDGSKFVAGFRTCRPSKMLKGGDFPDFNIAITTPEGVTQQEFMDFEMDACSFSAERCDCHYGPNYVTGDWKEYEIHIEGASGLGCDLRYEASLQPFRQGTGVIEFDDDPASYYTDLPLVKAAVTGTITYGGGVHEVRGFGYHDHQWIAISPFKAFHHWLWGHLYTEHYTLYIYDFVTAKPYGYRHVPFFGVQDNATGRTLFVTDGSMSLSTELEHQDQMGKEYPRRSHYTFSNANGDTCTFDVEWESEIELRNMFGNAPAPQRLAFRAMGVRPTYIRYYAHGSFELRRGDETVSEGGEMIYEYNYMGREDSAAGV